MLSIVGPLTVHPLHRTLQTLGHALEALEPYRVIQESMRSDSEQVRFNLYRNAAIKSFELTLETAGKLMRKALKCFVASPRLVDTWVFNDVLRHAGKHGILSYEEVKRWLQYRANRNTTAHDYGKGFANQTLTLLPAFMADAKRLAHQLQKVFDAAA